MVFPPPIFIEDLPGYDGAMEHLVPQFADVPPLLLGPENAQVLALRSIRTWLTILILLLAPSLLLQGLLELLKLPHVLYVLLDFVTCFPHFLLSLLFRSLQFQILWWILMLGFLFAVRVILKKNLVDSLLGLSLRSMGDHFEVLGRLCHRESLKPSLQRLLGGLLVWVNRISLVHDAHFISQLHLELWCWR